MGSILVLALCFTNNHIQLQAFKMEIEWIQLNDIIEIS